MQQEHEAAQKRHKKSTGRKERKQQHNAKQSKAAKDGGGSGDIGDIGGGNIVEGRRSNADTLDKASDHHQNRIVVARWQQSRRQQQLATRPEAGERTVGSMVTSEAAASRIAIKCSSGKS